MAAFDCPESIYGWHDAYDREGKCCLCRKKIAPKLEMPTLDHKMKSEAVLAYEYFYDPDYGNDRHDTY